MKINRLLEIMIILLNRKTVTARELAERFNVSTRTIYRDIDVLSGSGVPVFATQGVNGGISLMEHYALSKTILTDKETDSILFALKTLKSTMYPEVDLILDKLRAIFKNDAADWMHIDFSPWGSNPNQYEKMTNIKNAVINGRVIEFDYISAANKRSRRQLEPLRLIFKSQAWYLWGWEPGRRVFRTFRISRIRTLDTLDAFDRNKIRIPEEETKAENEVTKSQVDLSLRFTKDALFRLYDDYDDGFISENPDGTYTVNISFPEDEWVYSYILSFGSYVEVLGPEHIRRIIKDKLQETLGFYSRTD